MTAAREERAPAAVPKYGPQSAFQPDEFAKTIQANGLWFRWSRAVECPCSMAAADQFDPSCPRCQGDGWWYVNPAAYDETHSDRDHLRVQCIFGSSGRLGRKDDAFGSVAHGEATMTFQAHTTVGFRDRFVSEAQKMGRSETLLRGGDRAAGSIVAVGKSRRSTSAQLEALRYEPLHVNFVADDSAGGTVYYPRVDFVLMEPQLTEPARLRWLPGRGPAVGALYTVHYDFRPVWVVDESPQAYASTLPGPASGAKGPREPQHLPTSFKVLLDFLTLARGA